MTYQNQAPARRPFGITLLAVLIVVSGLLGLIGAIAVIIARGNDDFVRDTGVGSSTLLWVGIVGVIIAVVYLLVARGLTRGSGLARGLAALVAVLSLASGIYQAIIHSGSLRWSAIVSALLALIVLMLLFSPRANAFFASH
ncbi:MAG TPA: hypothetical protein VES60_05705 [Nakamurella sp.]|nr:hypothetical protein [Nakamurella sp.]